MSGSRLTTYLGLTAWWGGLAQAWTSNVLSDDRHARPYLVVLLALLVFVTVVLARMRRNDRAKGRLDA